MSTKSEILELEQIARAEQYINWLRAAIVGLLALLFLYRLRVSSFYTVTPGFPWHLGNALGGVVFLIVFSFLLKARIAVRFLPWIALLADIIMTTIAILSDIFAVYPRFPAWNVSSSSMYASYFVIILFSVLRHSPANTLAAGILSALSYGLTVFIPGQTEPQSYYYLNEGFKVAFLAITGVLAGANARTLRHTTDSARNSEARRQEADSQLKSLAGNLPGAIFQVQIDKRGNSTVSFLSHGVEDLLGVKVEQLSQDIGQFLQHLSPEVATVIRTHGAHAMVNDTTWSEEFSYPAGAENPKWIRIIVNTQKLHKGGWVMHGLMLNVTARKMAEFELIRAREDAEEANRAKTAFLANMSHELRTPLNGILGITELLQATPLDANQQASLATLKLSGENLLSLISDVLDFSKIEAGRLRIEEREVNLGEMIEEVRRLFEKDIRAKGLELRVFYLPRLPEPVLGDPLRIKQILVNLVGNALKFTSQGHIDIEVVWKPVSGRQLEIGLTIRDTGIGIAPRDRQRIFEKFTQAEESKSRRFGGAGLGLTISRSLAQLMGGDLTVESEPGRGSAFTLTLKTSLHRLLPVTKIEKKDKPMKNPAAVKVLLVEDNEINQDVQSRMLQKLGVSVDVVSSGIQALEKVRSQSYQLVFMDWQMPIMDGQETTTKIRQMPEGKDLVVVGLSGHALPGDREALLESGFNDYLSKPVRMADFQAVLEKWIKD